jgi:putative ABC transport system permease protein
VRTFRNLLTLNAGFEQDHILIAAFDFSPLKLPAASQMAYKRELLARMQSIPGVSAAAETLVIPISHSGWDNNIDIPRGPQRQDTMFNRVSPAYFHTMEIPLLAGRDFNENDTPGSTRVAIVNEAFARKFMGGSNPVGKIFNDSEKPDDTYQIVGLVKDTKYYELREDNLPIAFVSFTQKNGPQQLSTLMIRSDQPLLPLISSIKRTANDISPSLVLTFNVLKTQIREGLLREQLMATLSGFFGALATVLAMVGLYGVISYMVVRRRNEIGVRMALGANRNNILVMVLKEAATLLVIGLVVGTALALAAGTAAASMLYGLKPSDPLTLGAAITGMILVAIVASLLPAHRASTVHPMDALREE